MSGLTIPKIPNLPAGYTVQLADMQNLAAAATFLLNKPMTRIRDTSGGQSITTSPAAVTFSVADLDIDGMWNVSNPTRLTVQTPGWYRALYSVNCGGTTMSYTSWITSTTGANNPAGAGVVSLPYWGGYAQVPGSLQAARPRGFGIWPFYLYAADYLQVMIQGSTTGASTATTAPGSATAGGSYFSLELVSI